MTLPFDPTRRSLLRLAALGPLTPLLGACVSAFGEGLDEGGTPAPVAGSSLRADPLVYAVTNRRPVPGAVPPYFTGDRGEDLIVSRVAFRPPPSGLIAKASNVMGPNWAITAVKPFESPEPLGVLADRASGRDVLVYVHGYNESFVSSVTNAAELSDDIAFQGVTVAFTWPSRAELFDYGYDRESALYSRDDLQRLLSTLVRNSTVGRVHVVAHSMGGLLTLETLREMANTGDRTALASKFGALVFAAPDVDADVFTSGVRRLGPLAPKMTLITNAGDRALAVSRRLAGGVPRAGAADRDTLEQLGVRVADASDYGWGIIRHDLFLSNADVRDVVRRAVERGRDV